MTAYTAAYADIRWNDTTRFRTQGQWISDQLENLGWAKQADTGQIDWATVVAPTTDDEIKGFEIRKTGDLYLKISYGSGYGAYGKTIWVQFATGTDGAGGIPLGKELTSRKQVRTPAGYNGASVKPGDDYVSGDANRLMITLTDDATATYGGTFVCQRVVDANGDYINNGEWTALKANYNAVAEVFHFGTGSVKASPILAESLSTIRTTKALGAAGSIPFLPIYTTHPTRCFAPFRDAYCAASSLVPFQTTVTIGGITYLSAYGGNTTIGVWGFTSAVNYALLVRYD